jgi:hypothetical protein
MLSRYRVLQVQLLPNVPHTGGASMRMLSDAALDPEVAAGVRNDLDDGAPSEEEDPGSNGNMYYRRR